MIVTKTAKHCRVSYFFIKCSCIPVPISRPENRHQTQTRLIVWIKKKKKKKTGCHWVEVNILKGYKIIGRFEAILSSKKCFPREKKPHTHVRKTNKDNSLFATLCGIYKAKVRFYFTTCIYDKTVRVTSKSDTCA